MLVLLLLLLLLLSKLRVDRYNEKRHKNLFGIKGFNAKRSVILKTTEFVKGKAVQVKEPFRAFDDWEESIAMHDELISTDPRYQAAMNDWQNWELFLKTLAPIYATSPKYIPMVSKIVVDYRLDSWDKLLSAATNKHSNCPGP